MIDTHCHLLPGLDDGPRDVAGSLVLADQMARAGVRRVICTPHYSWRFPTDHAQAGQRLEELRELLGRVGIPLQLALAAELAPVMVLDAPDEELLARRIGERYLLVELQRDSAAGTVELLLDRLQALGCLPVLAHPERCVAVQREPSLVDNAREQGALVQVVSPSLTGRWGAEAAAVAWDMIETGRADLLASDAHRSRKGRLHLTEAIALLAGRIPPPRILELTTNAPGRLFDLIGRAPSRPRETQPR